jgi:hypothetical protein
VIEELLEEYKGLLVRADEEAEGAGCFRVDGFGCHCRRAGPQRLWLGSSAASACHQTL